MNRTSGLVVTNEMVGIDKEYPIFQGNGVFERLHWNEHQAHGIFERNDSRFHVTLTKILDVADTWIISVPNFFFSHQTHSPRNIAYKMRDRDIAVADAESAQVAIRMMFQLMLEYAEQNEKDIRMQLVYADFALGKAVELITEGNQNGNQMDYVSHPAASNVFDELYRKAMKIEKIMYQK